LQIDRVTADARSYHHKQPRSSQALCEVYHRLIVDVFLWQLFPGGLQSDFQLINRLGLRLKFMALFQHDTSNVIVQCVKIWRVLAQLIFLNKVLLNKASTVHLQPIMRHCKQVVFVIKFISIN